MNLQKVSPCCQQISATFALRQPGTLELVNPGRFFKNIPFTVLSAKILKTVKFCTKPQESILKQNKLIPFTEHKPFFLMNLFTDFDIYRFHLTIVYIVYS